MWPLLLLGGGAAALAVRRSSPRPPRGRWPGWVWPMAALGGRFPVISDEFKAEATDDHRRHRGVDIMYRRLEGEPAELPQGSKRYYVPAETPVLSAGPGKIWAAGVSARGHFVQVDHGRVNGQPLNTFYQHLSGLAREWSKGDMVKGGDVLGTVGGDPEGYPLWHLHFEVWVPRGKVDTWSVDPAPYLRKWGVIRLPRKDSVS